MKLLWTFFICAASVRGFPARASEQNLLQTSAPQSLVHPLLTPEDFLLDLRNLTELSDTDVDSQNIQVTIEVDHTAPETEVEMDLDGGAQVHDWSNLSSDWSDNYQRLFWTLIWDQTDTSQREEHLEEPHPGERVQTEEEPREEEHEPKDKEDVVQRVTDVTPTNIPDTIDGCQRWLSCKNNFLLQYQRQVLTRLPGCPCMYPLQVVYGAVDILDADLRRTFRWRDASGPRERLDIYKPSARFCISSMLSYDSRTPATQHCCYDDQTRLITRGKGAGSPDLVSVDFNSQLHHQVDVLPWILCKGDWTRLHSVRPPNNRLQCQHNPDHDQFLSQLTEAQEY